LTLPQDPLIWRTSRYSNAGNECIEVARTRDGLAVRDSKNPGGPRLALSTVARAAFTARIRANAARGER
jgi:hypothetical protein